MSQWKLVKLEHEGMHPNILGGKGIRGYTVLTELTIKELFIDDLCPGLLQHFNRFQETHRWWRIENDKWILKDMPFTEQWNDELKQEIVAVDFTNCLKSGGFVWGAFSSDNKLIAFASLLSKFFGSQNQYIQLMQIHASYEYRNMGIGKNLFRLCSQRAKQIGAKKLYISACSSEESQHFYKSIGCVDAEEINEEIAAHEPNVRQMEYVLLS